MAYIPLTPQDEQEMLQAVGVSRIQDFFSEIPSGWRLKNGYNLPPGLSETALKRFFSVLAKSNASISERPCFLGAGWYFHEIPAAVKASVLRPEFLTAYTPYQPEASQGTLQVLFDFQTIMAQLTGLEVANASLYDGATACAEAVLLALRWQKSKGPVFLSRALHPSYRRVVAAYLQALDTPCREIPLKGTQTDLDALSRICAPGAVVVLQQPNFLGGLEHLEAFSRLCREKNAKLIGVVTEAVNLGLVGPPGASGVDLCAGSAQSLGNPLAFGGPHAGFLTAPMEVVRQVPGRLVGETIDRNGRVGCVLTLQTREQHIRRERAVSNVCTTQSLMANFAAAWMYLKGGAGLQRVAVEGAVSAFALARGLSEIPGFRVETTRYVNELVVRPPKPGFAEFLAEWGVVAPYPLDRDYPEFKDCVLVCTTELTEEQDLETFLAASAAFAGASRKDVFTLPPRELAPWIEPCAVPDIPEHSEIELVRRWAALAKRNFSIDENFYPLGSCTMKYNPKINEEIATQDVWLNLHPLQREEEVQGALQVMWELEQWLKEITGCARVSLQPAAGAHGELTALWMARRYFHDSGQPQRKVVLIPVSAHGTNPASAAQAGFQVKTIGLDARGNTDLGELKKALCEETAVLMLTNPSTLGLWEENLPEIVRLVHEAGALLYYDGANLNALMGISRPADMGFDLVHLNLHKTFSTPHGGGGPGAGPVGASEKLAVYLPGPLVEREGNRFFLKDVGEKSVGRVFGSWGNFAVLLRALCYCKRNGKEGLERIGPAAVLNANYLMHLLKNTFSTAYARPCMHEFVLTAQEYKKRFGVSALDIAKRLLDFGFHPPTVYFPLVVSEALMVEPTETETKETLEAFAEAMRRIREEAEHHSDVLKTAPRSLEWSRFDEVLAVKEPRLSRRMSREGR